MVYDEAREQVVLFGGTTPGGVRGDMWTWNGEDWRRRAAPGTPRLPHLVSAYDAARKTIVVYGTAWGKRVEAESRTWVWDGAAWTPFE